MDNHKLVMPEHLNHYGYLFGGNLLQWVDEYAYIANVPEHPGKHTYCPGCQELLIQRVGYIATTLGLADGRCARCGLAVPGIWQPPPPPDGVGVPATAGSR